jgi:hypothetical protein
MMRCLLLGLSLALCVAGGAGAQDNATLRRAVSAYGNLSYGDAVGLARRALGERLNGPDQERAYEILGFAYAALDSARPATEAFKQVLLLNPDRTLDPGRISPKITSLFALALGQVLVVRQFEMDSGSFVAGSGALPFRFTVSRTARLRTRILGVGIDALIDSTLGDGTMRLAWNGLMRGQRPAATGSYRIIVEASAGRDSYAASFPVRVIAGTVDTLPHLTSLPGYQLLPETVMPSRSWRPFALASLAAAGVAGASLALENSTLRGSGRRELMTVSVGTALVGLLATAKRPAPVPSEANIRYNRLVQEQVARRNTEIAAENSERRRKVKLVVVPERRLAGAR